MTRRSARRGAHPYPSRPLPPAPEVSAAGRQLHATLAALHLGATAMATLGGLALYIWLAQAHVAALIAIVAGLVFALLGRFATIALAREWLVRTAITRRTSPTVPSPRGRGGGARATGEPPAPT